MGSLTGRLVIPVSIGLALVAATGFVDSAVWSQDGAAQDDPKAADDAKQAKGSTPSKSKRKTGGLRVPVGRVPKGKEGAGAAADPLQKAAEAANAQGAQGVEAKGGQAKAKGRPVANPNLPPPVPVWPFHYTLRLAGGDGTPLAAEYYPAQTTFEAPVVVLIHPTGSGRAAKDFSQPIEELKGKSFSRYLQEQGFAVFVFNPRAPRGGAPNAPYSVQDWRLMVTDLQNTYRFLVDRNNRGEINLSKLGVVALGDASNLAVAWAGSPDGGVSNEGRLSDIGAIALVSPLLEAPGLTLTRSLPTIATRFPILAISGDRDQASIQAVRDNQRVIERHRLSRVAFFDTSLHAGKLLNFYPKIATSIERFMNDPVKNRKAEWEPRFLLEPVVYADVQLVADSGFAPQRDPQRGAPAAKNAEAKKAANEEPKKAAANPGDAEPVEKKKDP